MSPVFDERAYEQVHAAIWRAVDREAEEMAAIQAECEAPPEEMPGYDELAQFAAQAKALAIVAVQSLAEDRSTSVEAVLDELIERP